MLAEMTGCQLTSLSEASSSNQHKKNRESQVPENLFGSSWYHPCRENHQAKRARVENILQRMAGTPPMFMRDGGNVRQPAVNGVGSSSEENWPGLDFSQSRVDFLLPPGVVHQTREAPEYTHALQANHQRDQSTQIYIKAPEEECPQSTALTRVVKHEHEDSHRPPISQISPVVPILTSSPSGLRPCVKTGEQRHRSDVKKTQSGPVALDTDSELLDLLKSELSRAVSTSVDLVFEKMAHCLSKAPHQNEKNKLKDETPFEHRPSLDITEPSQSNIQTEALSLVLQKPLQQDISSKVALMRTSFPETNSSHGPPSQSKQNNLLVDPELQQHSPSNALERFSCRYNASPSSLDFAAHSRELIKVTSRGMSHCMTQQAQLLPMSHLAFDSLSFPNIKRETPGVAESTSFLPLNISFDNSEPEEGFTPGHLKKAKLMFFYTRYPSSNVLKTFFPDVKFTRCITSQLIKWFSNFREFYYIQMEKYARHAVAEDEDEDEGVIHTRGLTVHRDSQLFRTLNTHYNKANDFQVPDRFLEVVEITLKEFYTAISLSRDRDPSWKKAIYKVICKLDSEVPAIFKSPLFTQ
ncbi:prospero homeobox protein 1-like [Engraulis encrasicolus]|uniref:prospero homeobox protein 1-like n=1 Tax=Engraulis encrasicolus TaxID=184585 RepID=UPI002FD43368